MPDAEHNCLATEPILSGGKRIGYMYREAPVNARDSGWRFFAGDENAGELACGAQIRGCGLSDVCALDGTIARLLKAPVGSVFYRDGSGRFVGEEPPAPQAPRESESLRRRLLGHLERYICRADYILYDRTGGEPGVDVAVIEPSEQLGFFTLLTLGMSDRSACAPVRGERTELFLCLPADWPLERGDAGAQWPVRLLRTLARLPRETGAALGYGSVVPNGTPPVPYAAGTRLCGAAVDLPELFDEGFYCWADPPDAVSLYCVRPVYAEELRYRDKFGGAALLDRLHRRARSPVLEPARKSVCGRRIF